MFVRYLSLIVGPEQPVRAYPVLGQQTDRSQLKTYLGKSYERRSDSK